jgi:glycosyltransferase involved in cell wall biosynthesis
VIIERVGGTDFGRYQLKGRICDIISFMWNARRHLSRLSRHDAIVALSSPPMVGMLALRFKKLHRVPLVLWVHDIYPEIAEKLGTLKNPFHRKWLYALARKIYVQSARIVVPGDDMKMNLEQRKEAAGKVQRIANWADLDEIQSLPVQENAFRKEQGWERNRVLMYSGNLGSAHEADTMLELIALLHADVPTLRFVLVGDTPRHQAFAGLAMKAGIHRITCFPSQSRARLGEILGAADAHLVSQKPEADGFLVPSKFYGVMAAGRPVIFVGSRTCELGRTVVESQLGITVLPGQAAAGLRAATKVLHMAQDENGVVAYIRDWAKTNASRNLRTREFQSVLEEVTSCP